MHIRPIQEQDASEVAQLAKQLGYNPSAQTVLPNIHAILENPAHQAFVYVDQEDQIIGWVHVFIALRLGSLPFAEISGMVVDQASQQQGIGRALVKQCRHWANSRGVGEIRVRCDSTREQANQFYQHIGFKQRKTQRVFVRELQLFLRPACGSISPSFPYDKETVMTTAIIGAMEQEVVALRKMIDNCDTYSFAGCEFYSGEINQHPVVVTRSGIGKVAAAIATTVLLQRYQPSQVINTGSAGGFDANLKVGDVVISEELRYHDVDLTAFNYEMGQLPANPAAYKADPQLIEIAEQAAKQLSGHKIVRGQICTGDIFMADPERVAKARADFPKMAAVEMEGAAIAQVCHLAEVPFVVIRSLSDIAGKESPASFDEFLETAAKHSTALVVAMLEQLKA